MRRQDAASAALVFEIRSSKLAAVSDGMFLPALVTLRVRDARTFLTCLWARSAFFPEPGASGSFLRTSFMSLPILFRVAFLMFAEASNRSMASRRQLTSWPPDLGVDVHWKLVPVATQRSSSVHSSWSSQFGGVPATQAPVAGSHVETPLHGLPSSHAFGVCTQPRPETHCPTVQGSPSSQSGGLVGVHTPARHETGPHGFGSQSALSVQGTHGSVDPAAQMGHGTVWAVQSLLQPSHSFWLPSSHCSLIWTTPSPQNSVRQVEEQPSFEVTLPSSHCSPQSIFPSPHSTRQKLEQPSQSVRLPSSHCSPGSRLPLPHVAGGISWQSFVQVADPVGPSSHCSPGSSSPLPQRSILHDGEHEWPAVTLLPSHSSPGSSSPFPHPGGVQLLSQESPLVVLPSSHCSPGCTMPSPHRGGAAHVQAGVQLWPEGQGPRLPSHTWFPSSTPFPQVGGPPPHGVRVGSCVTPGFSGTTVPVMTGTVFR